MSDFLPEKYIPDTHKDLLPICPCGCQSKLAEHTPMSQMPTPEYVKQYHKEHGFSWLETERHILRNEAYVEDRLVHRMRHLKLMMPWITHDPHLVRMMQTSYKCEDLDRRILNMIGHASSGKTNLIVVETFQELDINPDYSEAFVASPYKTSGEYLLWQEFDNCYQRLRANNYPIHKVGNTFSLRKRAKAGAGTVTFVAFHSVGVMRGKKMIQQGKGRLIVSCDEIGEFQNDSILRIIANLKSQPGFRMRTGTNFRGLHELDGKFNHPLHKEWSDLKRKRDYEWMAVNGGYTIRFAAEKSPNIAMGVDYYGYLLRDKEHKDLLEYGVNSPDYLAQGDAFPDVNSLDKTLISVNEIQGARTYQDIVLAPNSEAFAFADPAFTRSGDSTIITQLNLGHDNSDLDKKYIKAISQEALLVDGEHRWDEELIALAHRLRAGKTMRDGVELGKDIDAYHLCALKCAKWCIDNEIPFKNFGYDDSLRGILTYAMTYWMGESITPYYPGGAPDDRIAFPKKKIVKADKVGRKFSVDATNNQLHQKMVSQMWFTASGLVKNGYVRNGSCLEAAFDQMTKRVKIASKSERKEDVESKDEYKSRNQNKSPDHADSFVGCCNMIVERRLTPKPDASTAKGLAGNSAASNLLEKAMNSSVSTMGSLSRQSNKPKLSR